MGIDTLHPNNHPQFAYGDKVDILLTWDNRRIIQGTIVGKATEHIIDMWLVESEGIFSSIYPYKVFSCPHPNLRLTGSNAPFGCE